MAFTFKKGEYPYPRIIRHKFDNEILSKVNSARIIKSGTIIEFKYDSKHPPEDPGGWHNDKQPRIVLIWDDKSKNRIFGLNINYLPWTHFRRVIKLIESKDFKYNGKMLYNFLLSNAKFASKRAYRIYYRHVAMKNAKLVVEQKTSRKMQTIFEKLKTIEKQ